ncbi:MAG: hypothetical protein A2514_12180 [Gammaproteobacteria bacterium RIFOXYD12_FULL_61_37]|nr:MAG: hypothetical protein A2514_12180 [Gammaproteobacteria bacterium RIFOXYD12_FULL_61_37]
MSPNGELRAASGLAPDLPETRDSIYRTMLNALDESVMIFSTEGRVIACNPSAERLTGMSLDQMRNCGLDDWRLLKEDGSLYEPHELPVSRTLATGEPCRGAMVGYTLPGDGLIWTLANTEPVFDPGNEQSHAVVLSIRDITEHKRAEDEQARLTRALLASSASNKALVHARDETSFTAEVCRIVVEMCGHAMAWAGQAEDDAEQSVRPIAHAGFEEGYLAMLQITWANRERGRGPTGIAIRTGRPAVCRHMLTDPAFLPWREEALKRGYASSIAFPLRGENRVLGALMIYSRLPDPFTEEEIQLLQKLADDMAYGIRTLRIRADNVSKEMALHASEERYRLLVEQMVDGIFVADAHGRYLDVNQAGAAMLGYSPEEIRRMSIADAIFPAEIPRIGPEVARFAHGTVAVSTWRFRRKDGSGFIGEMVGRHLPDGRLQVVVRDVTARSQAEEELREARLAAMNLAQDAVESQRSLELANIALLAEIDEREVMMRELKQARTAADTANRAKSEFLANMSHEIRTPLNAVLGLAQVGQRDNGGRRSQETFSRILHSGQLLLSLINDILDFSKIEASKMALEQEPFDLGEAIDRAVDVNNGRAFARGLDFAVEEDADLPQTCIGDGLRLTQILVNLLSNAIKFTDRGQVRLIALWRDGGLVFRIEDSGIGMTPDQVERLFKPFEQADGSTTRRFGGTGLGLTISKRLVELMGGTIGVESQAGAGSQFEVRLPLPAASGPIRTQAGGRILLAGLTGPEAALLRTTLAGFGAETLLSASAQDVHAGPEDLLVVTEEQMLDSPAWAEPRAIRRLAVAHRPIDGEGSSPSLPLGARRLDRPLRARHLLAALEAPAVAEPKPAQGPRLTGYRILAAEDNEVNRFVLERMIADEGAYLQCVENGRLAVDQVRRDGPGAWDILLMDIQMPEMDGHEATRRIREFAPDLPIVGLTAHAQAEERDRCLASGMRAHLAKPVELEDLIGCIRHHARPPRQPGTDPSRPALPAAPPQGKAPAGQGLIDWNTLETRFAAQPGFVAKLAAVAGRNQAETPAKLRAAAGSGNLEDLAYLAHALKGVAGNLAAESIQEQAAQIHQAAQENNPDAIARTERLAAAVEQLLTELAAHETKE